MDSCCVYGCDTDGRNLKERGLHLFKFPRNKKLSKQWLYLCKGKDKVNVNKAAICSAHFSDDDFNNPSKNQVMGTKLDLKPNAVPSKHLPSNKSTSIDKGTPVQSMVHSQRASKRQKIDESALTSVPHTETYTNDSTTLENNELQDLQMCSVQELKKKCQQLREEKEQLLQQFQALENIFTPGQIRRLLQPNKLTPWEDEDIIAAIALRSMGSKCYNYLRDVKKFPLPSVLTLKNWVKGLDFEPGVLIWVLELMKEIGKNLNSLEKLVVLTIEEIHISNANVFDKKHEKVCGSHKTCQVMMCRGLIGNWKQPIFYGFDVCINKDLFFKVVSKLYVYGFTVVSVTCGLDLSNAVLWKELNIGHQRDHNTCFCIHPSNEDLYIYFFADTLSLLKLARNSILDHGFLFNGVMVDKALLEKILEYKKDDLYLTYKLTPKHFNCEGSDRHDVNLAVALMSTSTALLLSYLVRTEIIEEEERGVAAVNIMHNFNTWLNLFNSKVHEKAFGQKITEQKQTLDKINTVISNIKVGGNERLQPFQEGILLNNWSIIEFFEFVNSKFNVQYILTSRLNQEVLENFFSILRKMETSDHLNALNVKSQMKWCLLGNNPDTSDNNIENYLTQCESFRTGTNYDDKDDIMLTRTLLSDLVDFNTINEIEATGEATVK